MGSKAHRYCRHCAPNVAWKLRSTRSAVTARRCVRAGLGSGCGSGSGAVACGGGSSGVAAASAAVFTASSTCAGVSSFHVENDSTWPTALTPLSVRPAHEMRAFLGAHSGLWRRDQEER